jgi:hypothetical protein
LREDYDVRVMRLSRIRSGLTSGREERRRLLSRGERVFVWSYTLLVSLLAPGGVVLLIIGSGVAHGLGIALLVAGLLAMAVPISLLLRARVRRREARAHRRQSGGRWR